MENCLYIVTGPWWISGSILENRTTQELVVFMAADTKLTIELESYPTLIICPFAVSSKFCWWGGRYRWRHFESASHFFGDNYTQPAIAMMKQVRRSAHVHEYIYIYRMLRYVLLADRACLSLNNIVDWTHTPFAKSNGRFFSETKINMLPSSNLYDFWWVHKMHVSVHFVCKIYWFFALTRSAPGF